MGKVLIVEPDRKIRARMKRLIKEVITDLSTDPVEVESGEEAVDEIRQSAEVILLVTRMNLGGTLTGLDVIGQASEQNVSNILFCASQLNSQLIRDLPSSIEWMSVPFTNADFKAMVAMLLDL